MKELASQMKFEEAADIRDRLIRAQRERLISAT
jgi:excinuclease UvrABC nuclease subunit